MGEGKQKRNLRKAIVSEAIGRIALVMFSEMDGIIFLSSQEVPWKFSLSHK